MTRARAFDWLGKDHPIPAMVGTEWLCADLDRGLASLQRGGKVTLDYRGAVAEGPELLLARSTDDVFSVQSLIEPIDDQGNIRAWSGSDLPGRLVRIRFDLMRLLIERRGAAAVVLIPPPDADL